MDKARKQKFEEKNTGSTKNHGIHGLVFVKLVLNSALGTYARFRVPGKSARENIFEKVSS
jgi:hypothetical protein